jgi:hypothetical protein
MIDPLGDDAARLLLEKMEYCADVQNGARNYRTEGNYILDSLDCWVKNSVHGYQFCFLR